MRRPPINKEIRVNERIRAREVRVVTDDGVQLGVLPIRDALAAARERSLDLIEIAPTANPPVCKIMDYGKFKYELGRKDREAHKKQKVTEVKGIRLRPGIDGHDLEVKLKHALEFLKDGNKVKVTVIFRAREITHPEFARKSLEKIAEAAVECAVVERSPSFEGRTMVMVLAPKPVSEKEKTAKKAEEQQADDKERPAEKQEAQVVEGPEPAQPRGPSKPKKTFEMDPDKI